MVLSFLCSYTCVCASGILNLLNVPTFLLSFSENWEHFACPQEAFSRGAVGKKRDTSVERDKICLSAFMCMHVHTHGPSFPLWLCMCMCACTWQIKILRGNVWKNVAFLILLWARPYDYVRELERTSGANVWNLI